MSSSHVQPVKPAALRPGDTVGIVAPASNIKRADLEAGCEALRRAGYRPFYFDSIVEQDLYFAGSVERRARELEEMFVRNDVRAIVCARGGYGANYLLKELDLEKIRAHPKILVGYSDITTLLTYVHDVGSFVTFHGPMAAKDWAHDDGVDLVSWRGAGPGTTPLGRGVGAGGGGGEAGGGGVCAGCGGGRGRGRGTATMGRGAGRGSQWIGRRRRRGRPVWRMPFHPGRIAGYAIRNQDCKHDPVRRRSRGQALSDRPHADAVEAGRTFRRSTRHCLRRNARLRADRESGLHSAGCGQPNCR